MTGASRRQHVRSILRRLGDPIGDLVDGEAFACAAFDDERRQDERHRPVRLRPELDDHDRNAARVCSAYERSSSGVGSPATIRTSTSAPVRDVGATDDDRARRGAGRASSLASCSASIRSRRSARPTPGPASALSVRPQAAQLARRAQRLRRRSQRSSIARAHPGRECSGARRSARGWRPWRTRRP